MCRHDENGLTSETEVIPQLNAFPYNCCCCHGVTLQHNRTVTATEVSTRERVASVTGLTVRFTGEIQKTGLWAGKVVGGFKGLEKWLDALLGHARKIMEDRARAGVPGPGVPGSLWTRPGVPGPVPWGPGPGRGVSRAKAREAKGQGQRGQYQGRARRARTRARGSGPGSGGPGPGGQDQCQGQVGHSQFQGKGARAKARARTR